MNNGRSKRSTVIAILSTFFILIMIAVSLIYIFSRDEAPAAAYDDVLINQEETVTSTTEAIEGQAVPELPDAQTLPILHLDGNISEMYEKSDERTVSFRYQDEGMDIEGFAQLKIQGNSSLQYEKKNYTIKLYQDQECSEKMKIDVGWGDESKYCLKANWIDKTHSRNIVTARIASQIQEKYNVLPDTPNHAAIDGFPIEIYNNGEFLGLYTFNIPKDEWLLNMDGDNPDHIAVCAEDWSPATVFTGEPNFTSWELEVGEDSPENLEKMHRLYDFVLNSTDEEFKENFHDYFNLDATLNYYLMVDFAFLKDNWAKNMLLVTYDSNIWYPCLYDMDTSWGTSWDGQSLSPYESVEIPLFENDLFRRLENCFSAELVERYMELRQDIFTKEHILAEFSSFIETIPNESFEKEQIRWGSDIPGFELDQIEDYLNTRIPVLDSKYADWNAWLPIRVQLSLERAQILGKDITEILNSAKNHPVELLNAWKVSFEEYVEIAEKSGIDVAAFRDVS